MRDTYICPKGKELKRWPEQRREGKPPTSPLPRGVFANVLGAQCEEDREESAPGHTHFA
jgi:hypothetical protein